METYFLKFSHVWFSSLYVLEDTYQISQTHTYALSPPQIEPSSDSYPE